jgi:hypothetical protein
VGAGGAVFEVVKGDAMSLDWDLTAISNHKKLWMEAGKDEGGKQEYKLRPVTETLIWVCLAIDIGEITENNWEEWFLRARVWERAMGVMRHDGKEDFPITPEEVKAHIGLKTNVFPKTTAAAFAKKLVAVLEREGRNELYKFKREQEQCVRHQSTAATG